jgi:predicted DCC family thiol-disulfide oxidoreductase YuxK
MPHTLILRRAANRDLVLPVKPTCNPRPALLFDGECGLCNRVVRVLLRLDRGGSLVFGPLQDPPAQGFLRSHGLPTRDFDSMVFVPDWNRREQPGFLLRTDGVLAALRFCGGAGRILAAALRILPAGCRDAGYRIVARWRYRVFGAWKPRPLARPEWAGRFLV